MELSATAKVILGMLAMHPRSGYEIKAFVDDSTRYFWAASYGQIYPELKRLAGRGLIEGTEDPASGRQRTVYRLTEAGMAELRDWHRRPAELYELRDEALLKLFLAGAVDPGRAGEIARERSQLAEATAERLREVESRAEGKDAPAYAVLRSGIAFHEFIAEHFRVLADELDADDRAPASAISGEEG